MLVTILFRSGDFIHSDSARSSTATSSVFDIEHLLIDNYWKRCGREE